MLEQNLKDLKTTTHGEIFLRPASRKDNFNYFFPQIFKISQVGRDLEGVSHFKTMTTYVTFLKSLVRLSSK